MSTGTKSAASDVPVPSENSPLADWLRYLEQLHSSEIDLGLERVAAVYQRSAQGAKPARFVITVAGTNGKGSTVCYLSEILQRAGYRVGVYTSPHLIDYRERVTINGEMLPSQDHVDAFVAIEQARQQTSLTYFEFGTLAALQLMQQQQLDVAILEVGLGGRLDAVNVVDADVAVVTSIGIDHVQFLGDNREQIGREKAGIARPNKPLVCGDNQPPKSIRLHAEEIGAKLLQTGKHFSYADAGATWHYRGIESNLLNLHRPQLPLINAATSLAALECLPLAVSADAIREGVQAAQLMGRMQLVSYQQCDVLLDVGHNPQAAEYLAREIPKRFKHRPVYAVVGMLRDKDHEQVFQHLAPLIQRWYLGTLTEPRGNTAEQLAQASALQEASCVATFATVEMAFSQALNDAQTEKPLVFVFGSFYTVGRINQQIRS